jgi:hypothetical protein
VVEAKWLRQNANRITMPNGVSSYHYQKNCKQRYQKNEALLHGEILEEQAFVLSFCQASLALLLSVWVFNFMFSTMES